MTNIQQIYDALYSKQEKLVNLASTHPLRNTPDFEIEILSSQATLMLGAIALILESLGAKPHD